MTRRHFLRNLAIGVAALTLRFKPEVQHELPKINAITLDQFNSYLERVFRVSKPGPQWVYCTPATYEAIRKLYVDRDPIP